MATRVLHLIKGLGPGGAEQLLVNQARATDDPDLEFTVAYLVSWKDHLVPDLERQGWATLCLQSDRAWDLRWIFRLRRRLAERPADVIHGHSPLVASLTRLMLRTIPRRRRPHTIYTEHNEWGRHRPWTRRLNRATIGLEDEVLAVSEGVRASMLQKRRVDVLVHGIDADAVAAKATEREVVRSELGIADDEIVIGTVANFRREKAYEVLLDAAAKICADDPAVRFVSVGQGQLEDEIRQQHADLGLRDRFLILGYRPDAPRIMSAYDVFTLSSRHEGLPVSLMEAMALRLPVVATAVGGVADALDDWPAQVVAPDDVEALAEGYRRMIAAVRAGEVDASGPLRFDAHASSADLARRYRSSTG